MTRDVKVHLLPTLFEPEEVRGGIAVIIDVLRASTTIVHALANGAREVIPCRTVDEARGVAAGYPPGTILTGGEREGLLIEGFDLDNNPFAYSRSVVDGKTLIFTTSNGTKALLRADQADRVLIGSFVNLQAIVNLLVDDWSRPIHLICAGTKGKITLEDSLCAGAIAQRLLTAAEDSEAEWSDDQLRLAMTTYCFWSSTPELFDWAMRHSFGGRNCTRLGFESQMLRAATCDLFDFVPEYDPTARTITARFSEQNCIEQI